MSKGYFTHLRNLNSTNKKQDDVCIRNSVWPFCSSTILIRLSVRRSSSPLRPASWQYLTAASLGESAARMREIVLAWWSQYWKASHSLQMGMSHPVHTYRVRFTNFSLSRPLLRVYSGKCEIAWYSCDLLSISAINLQTRQLTLFELVFNTTWCKVLERSAWSRAVKIN